VLVSCVVWFVVNDVKTALRCSDTVTDNDMIVITTIISVIAADFISCSHGCLIARYMNILGTHHSLLLLYQFCFL